MPRRLSALTILTRSNSRSLATTAESQSRQGQMKLNQLTHIQPPSNTLHSAIEPVRKIAKVSILWMESPPDINKFGLIFIRWVENIFKC